MKKVLLLLALPLLLSCQSVGDCQPANSVSIATFNIRIFSDGSRDDEELQQICEILKRYDFIAIQELRDTDVLDRTVAMLQRYKGAFVTVSVRIQEVKGYKGAFVTVSVRIQEVNH